MDQAPRDIVDTIAPDTVTMPADTCDACGAKAFVFVDLQPGRLAYCAHHGAKYRTKLLETGAKIIVFDLPQ